VPKQALPYHQLMYLDILELQQLVFVLVLEPENTAYSSKYLIDIKTSQKIVIETMPHIVDATNKSCYHQTK
jgi:hypothetical protein